jgi:hypothetical protein
MPTPRAVPPLHGYLPAQPARTYGPVGHCVYCGSTHQLSDEHIIPLGLGGRLVLPQSSCSSCSAKTTKFERTCLRTMYGPLRLLYGLPSRRKNSRPETLQLKIKRTKESEWEYVPVVKERYPFLITFPYFEAPGALAGTDESAAPGPVTSRLWIRGASPHHDFQELLQSLVQELGVHSLMPESKAEVSAFCSLLAKIALSHIAADIGVSAQRSRLAHIALGQNMNNCMHYIGSVATDEPPSNSLHEISLARHARTGSILVRLRLLAKLGTPTYFVVLPPAVAKARPNTPLQRTVYGGR